VSPLDFIPLAEETGLIIPLDRIILEKACREMAELNAGREVPVKLALNSSAKALLKKKFPDELKTVLDKTGMKPEWFELEITETEMMKDLDATLDVITRTAELGISIALDDFGTGYSSLSQLSRIPVNTLKIDRSFVIKIEDPDTRVAMVDTINKMAKDLKLKVVAEGVETAAQLTYLENIGCDMIQGYLISKPLPYADFRSFLETFRLKNLESV
jgi:EAL domain-containing protein (putative c-di-GMP-specific phosphodiesterase class I)